MLSSFQDGMNLGRRQARAAFGVPAGQAATSRDATASGPAGRMTDAGKVPVAAARAGGDRDGARNDQPADSDTEVGNPACDIRHDDADAAQDNTPSDTDQQQPDNQHLNDQHGNAEHDGTEHDGVATDGARPGPGRPNR